VPLARKSVIAGIFCSKPPRFDSIDPGRLFFVGAGLPTFRRDSRLANLMKTVPSAIVTFV
jgi:hypothetical protein